MRAVFHLLSRLAHTGAYLMPAAEGQRASAVLVFSPRNGFRAPVGQFEDRLRAEALARAWIAADASAARWRITASGARALKAARAKASTVKASGRAAVIAGPVLNHRESPLTWLRRRKDRQGRPLISAPQFDAGERLRAELWHAELTPRVTAGWSGLPAERRRRRSGPAAKADPSDHVVAARQRVRAALIAVGPEFAGLLIDVLGHLKGLEDIEREEDLPRRSGKLMLCLALARLARHYGLSPPEADAAAVGRRLRHWGAPDYRPTLETWE
jgi:hypothetical protein